MHGAPRFTLLLLALLGVVGCFSFEPHDDVDFQPVTTVEDLEGSYRNVGETDARHTRPAYLSEFIWPDDEVLEHASVEIVTVQAIGADKLRIIARSGSGVVKQGTYTEGEHFELRAGRVRLVAECEFAGDDAGEPGLGYGCTTVELGVDQRGQGKYQNKAKFFLLAFLLIPMAGRISDEVRFVRVEDPAS